MTDDHDQLLRIAERERELFARLDHIEKKLSSIQGFAVKTTWIIMVTMAAIILHLFGITNIWEFLRGH